MCPDGDKAKFCQIYQIDHSQEALERRMEAETGGQNLDDSTLRELQRLMKYRNPYAQAITNCGDRIKDSEDVGVKVTLKQHDPRRAQKGTHNKPTSDEVAAVMIIPEDLAPNEPILRNVVVQGIRDGYVNVPYWHSSYMALRYPLLFPQGEQSWTKDEPLVGHTLSNDLHACRRRPNQHPLQTDNPENAEAGGDEEGAGVNDGAPSGRGGSSRVTLKEFYRMWMQVSPINVFFPLPHSHQQRACSNRVSLYHRAFRFASY